MVFSEYTKRRILFYEAKGYRSPKIVKLLEREGIVGSTSIDGPMNTCAREAISDRRDIWVSMRVRGSGHVTSTALYIDSIFGIACTGNVCGSLVCGKQSRRRLFSG